MFRVHRFIKLANITSRTLTGHSTSQILSVQAVLKQHQKLYSKDNDDSSEKKKIPYLDECKKKAEALSQDCSPPPPEPEPVCAYEKENKWDNYKNAVWLGLLVTAATLGALYAAGFFDKKQVCPPKVVKKRKKGKCVTKDPKSSKEIPAEVPYLLIGGGTASFAAFRAIKSADPTAKVLVITNECFLPYMRPPLSKEMWFNDDTEAVKKLIFKQWNGSERNLYYEPEDFYIKCRELKESDNGGVAVAKGWTVSRLDVVEKIAYLDNDYQIHYDKCLVATGASPKNLAVFEVASSDPEIGGRIKLFRNIYDFEDVYDTFDETESVAVVGGGFLGSELACALARKGKKKGKRVYQIFREAGNMGKILPEYLSSWTTAKVKSEGVCVLGNTEVVGVQAEDDKLTIHLSNGKTVKVDQAVVAVGVEPNTALAEKSGLEVDPELGGFLVNTELMARSNLYVAGDCSCFYDVKLGRRRIEHHDHAVVSGRLAGENMAGQAKPYLHQSMFWSDLGPDVGYEAIGIIDANLPTVGVFAKATDKDNPKAVVTATNEGIRSKTEAESKASGLEGGDNVIKSGGEETAADEYGKGVVFYLRDDVVVGIVLWNVFNRMSVARQVLKDERKYDDLNEVAKLFNIHEE